MSITYNDYKTSRMDPPCATRAEEFKVLGIDEEDALTPEDWQEIQDRQRERNHRVSEHADWFAYRPSYEVVVGN